MDLEMKIHIRMAHILCNDFFLFTCRKRRDFVFDSGNILCMDLTFPCKMLKLSLWSDFNRRIAQNAHILKVHCLK